MEKRKLSSKLLTVFFTLITSVWVLPVIIVLYNSLKSNEAIKTSLFSFPNAESFVGLENFFKGITHGNYPFYNAIFYSFVITLLSVALILLCTSMTAWYIKRVDSPFTKMLYYLCIFSMVVPFQMVMFTLSKTADKLGLDTPYTIPIIYLGFGAGLAVFLFSGFVSHIPLEIEEAAMIDGCTPLQTFFRIVFPVLKPITVTVAILQTMCFRQTIQGIL